MGIINNAILTHRFNFNFGFIFHPFFLNLVKSFADFLLGIFNLVLKLRRPIIPKFSEHRSKKNKVV